MTVRHTYDCHCHHLFKTIFTVHRKHFTICCHEFSNVESKTQLFTLTLTFQRSWITGALNLNIAATAMILSTAQWLYRECNHINKKIIFPCESFELSESYYENVRLFLPLLKVIALCSRVPSFSCVFTLKKEHYTLLQNGMA